MLPLFHLYCIFVWNFFLVLFSITRTGLSVTREGGKALSIAVPVKIGFTFIAVSFCEVFMTVKSLSAVFLNFRFSEEFLPETLYFLTVRPAVSLPP